MRKNRKIKVALVVAALMASPVQASEYSDQVIQWLESLGFTNFQVERTWLGRIKIEAYGEGIEREIILNPRTGEILRDYWEYDNGYQPNQLGVPLAIPYGMGNTAEVQPLVSKDHDNENHANVQQVITTSKGSVQDDASNEGSPETDHATDDSGVGDNDASSSPVVTDDHADANDHASDHSSDDDKKADDKKDDQNDGDKKSDDHKDDDKKSDDENDH